MMRDERGLGIDDLDYRLPEELIAQQPAPERDASRLLVVDRATGVLRDTTFGALPELLSAGDLLVLNDTKVVPAKLRTRRATGGGIDALFVRDLGDGEWEVLLRGRGRLKVGERLALEPDDRGDALELAASEGMGRWRVRLVSDDDTQTVLSRVGQTPLPPYIRRAPSGVPAGARDRPEDAERYQTVFARRPGAVAAPTASLHFTPGVLAGMNRSDVERAFVTLHVGPGTFSPIAVASLDEHRMHAEWYDLPAGTVERIAACRARGGRVVAAGTTTVRVLEQCCDARRVVADAGWTDIFIRPPYTFGAVDVLLTNFHLPRSTLLALVMAFAGVDLTRAAYAHAIADRYRFYSYGDAMLIL